VPWSPDPARCSTEGLRPPHTVAQDCSSWWLGRRPATTGPHGGSVGDRPQQVSQLCQGLLTRHAARPKVSRPPPYRRTRLQLTVARSETGHNTSETGHNRSESGRNGGRRPAITGDLKQNRTPIPWAATWKQQSLGESKDGTRSGPATFEWCCAHSNETRFAFSNQTQSCHG